MPVATDSLQRDDPIADEMRFIEHAMRRLGVLRYHFTYDERLRIGELMRDAADALDRGI